MPRAATKTFKYESSNLQEVLIHYFLSHRYRLIILYFNAFKPSLEDASSIPAQAGGYFVYQQMVVQKDNVSITLYAKGSSG